MKSTKEPAGNGSHAVEIARKPTGLAEPLPSPLSYLRRVTDDLERQLATWGMDIPWLERPTSWLFPRLTAREALWMPEAEVVQREGALVVKIDVPGATKDDLAVEVLDDAIVISGERKQEEKEEREGFYRSERRYGKFTRTIPLPEGAEPETTKAQLRDGVLEVTIKAPATRKNGRKIEIGE